LEYTAKRFAWNRPTLNAPNFSTENAQTPRSKWYARPWPFHCRNVCCL